MSRVSKMEVYFTDGEGKRTKTLEVFMPSVSYSFSYPMRTMYCMASPTPIVEHTGQVEFEFKGSGLQRLPPKPKKAKPLSKRAQKALEERIAEQEGWED